MEAEDLIINNRWFNLNLINKLLVVSPHPLFSFRLILSVCYACCSITAKSTGGNDLPNQKVSLQVILEPVQPESKNHSSIWYRGEFSCNSVSAVSTTAAFLGSGFPPNVCSCPSILNLQPAPRKQAQEAKFCSWMPIAMQDSWRPARTSDHKRWLTMARFIPAPSFPFYFQGILALAHTVHDLFMKGMRNIRDNPVRRDDARK